MSSPIIEVENVSKLYRLGQFNARSLRDEAERLLAGLGGRRGQTEPDGSDFWALKDVSFSVQPGEVVGIIGRNGAGKSTLLKILSRVTEPTGGKVRMRGRVASLLEVGTGFHPELTGRENVFLNGAVLGMTRAEVKAKFDEIVAFAEIDRFLDTPVKRYSSGMYVRLAFAVAAHLEPEILIVDEVLAVGDVDFQQKCLGKMEDVSRREGRTVLFVSHNLSAVRRLCSRVVVMNHGAKIADDEPTSAVLEYLRTQDPDRVSRGTTERTAILSEASDEADLLLLAVFSENDPSDAEFHLNRPISIKIGILLKTEISNFHVYIRLYRADDVLVFASADWDDGEVEPGLYEVGEYEIIVSVPAHLLNAGRYYISVDGLIPSLRYVFRYEHAAEFELHPFGGAGGVESVRRNGVVRPMLRWERRKLPGQYLQQNDVA